MVKTKYMKVFFPLFILSLFLTGLVTEAYADTQYVSDRLIITMREGMGNEFKIIKTLKTGTPLEVLEETEQYYKVQIEDGKEGWVLKRYITTDIPKPLVIAGLKREIEKLKKGVENLRKERDASKKDIQSSRNSHKEQVKELEKSISEKSDQISGMTKKLQDMTNKYNTFIEDSGDIVKIISERDMLKEENTRLSKKKNDLLQKNERLLERGAILWFLAGASVFFFGWIAGKLSRKKKRFY